MNLRQNVFRPIRLGMALTFVLFGLTRVFSAEPFDQSHADYDRILKTHIVGGAVDYKALKQDDRPLRVYLARLAAVSETDFKTWKELERLAFLTNLYNATTMQLIVDRYPIKSIKDIGGFFKGPWDQPAVGLFGKKITLGNLEHDILPKEYNEPRLHMALVCAAKGCPPLRNEAYTASDLDSQLDDQSKTYLASPRGLRLDRSKGEVYISSIFKWYKKDFPSVTAFIEKHTTHKVKDLRIRYLDYDWSLNGK